MISSISIELSETPKPEWESTVRKGLSQYNREQVGSREVHRLSLFARDEHDRVIGGILGESIWGCMLIETFWVAEDARDQGLGTKLLTEAEKIALQRGCRLIVLETFSFQALPFYQKLGYVIYGQLDGFPPGETRYSLKKDLIPDILTTDSRQQDAARHHQALYSINTVQPASQADVYTSALYQIMIDLLNRHDVSDLLQSIVDYAATILDAPYGEIMLVEGDELVVKAFTRNQPNLLGDRVKRGQALVSWRAFDSHQPVLIDNYFEWSGKRVVYDDAQLQAVADFPIMLGNSCLGVLAMARTTPDYPFGEREVQRGMQFAQLVAVVLDNISMVNTAQQEITERERTEQRNQAFMHDIRALQELSLELSEIEDLTTLYKKMIQLGQQRLGIDRMGLFVLDETETALVGTYGTDAKGNFRDESYYREPITADHWSHEIVNSPNHVKIWESAPIYDDGNRVGTGWKTASALWNGQKSIGFVVSDSFVTRRPARPYEAELLSIIGSTYGHLIERKRAEQRIQTQNEMLVKTNRELAIARKQAENANKLKSQFLATMSHELRTPLNAIIGYAQLQLAGIAGEMTEEQLGFQDRIVINAQHLLSLINEVLDLSKIEAGRMELVEKPFHLRACFNEIYAQNRILAENKGLKFTLNFDDQLPESIIGDQGRIKQMIINLIANAIKFTDQGSVKLDVTLYDPQSWRISVADTGIGIPSHALETIFDEFHQADDGLHRGGTGLGLAITRKLILMMGGHIRVQSEVGKGSIFTILLPFVEQETRK